ncbi:protein-disulfide reductase DsbD [Ideonella paludis]|uniref:Thiol:disulfide interchange protein DsbD n=1 Tax=Ideonella paludis TaxID=1233411 RepID=A0ABS5DZF6_9BURK|nr:protein-disulfide reductase DsbD [Ideonella paludis]MBQ0936543.1 protein-disulfide reductase DsbD [Ideonella paludis]
MTISSFWRPLQRRLGLCVVWASVLWALLVPAAQGAQEFLEPEQAFKFSVKVLDERTAQINFEIAPGYYLYRERLSVQVDAATLGPVVLPAGKVKFDETFQKEVETWREQVTINVPLVQAAGPVLLQVMSQGCADAGLCYPPMTSQAQLSLAAFGGNGSAAVVTDAAAAPSGLLAKAQESPAAAAPSAVQDGAAAVSTQEGSRVERLLQGGSYLAVVGGFAVMGLLLAFTPCVLPMLPILSSIIAGGGEVSRRKGLALAFAYSLGMSLVYTALGVAAGLAGEGLAAALQKPWVLLSFGLLLAVLSLSMFDVFELRLPLALSGRLDGVSRRLPGGQFAGVFLMGGLSALIVSPCVTAPLAGALLFLSKTGDVWLAGSALFAMAWGMSVPLLILGASAGRWLPRSGSWMHAIKRFFGLLLLGVALWIVQPVLPSALALVAWGVLALVAGFMLRPFDPHPHSAAPRVWVQRAGGLALLTVGVLQLAGASSGGMDPLQPLGHWGRASAAPASVGPQFQKVKSEAELEAILKNAGRPVMLDFYADWCVSCKEMERFTFSDPAVQARLSKALLLKADVTANTPDDKALLKRFHLFGPPGTIFFDAQGKELPEVRVMGFQSARDFEKTLMAAGL